MELEKNLLLDAPPARVWELLLDPRVMGACVPGMQSIEVISPVEYVSVIAVKIAFVSARFKIKTTIVEQRAPHYLRTEGTGEDASVASSFRQGSEMFLDEQPDGRTAVRMLIKIDVLGRLGTFGLNVMKTKADRMWDEFGVNLAARLLPGAPALEPEAVAAGSAAEATTAAAPSPAAPRAVPMRPTTTTTRPGWWARLFGAAHIQPVAAAPTPARLPNDIFVEVRRGESTVTVLWPAQSANECAAWLRDYLR
jgi:uncharacterized protein